MQTEFNDKDEAHLADYFLKHYTSTNQRSHLAHLAVWWTELICCMDGLFLRFSPVRLAAAAPVSSVCSLPFGSEAVVEKVLTDHVMTRVRQKRKKSKTNLELVDQS